MPFQITEFTYGTAIQEICKLVGHPSPVDPAGSTDTAVQQMGAAVNTALEQLLTMYEWQDLTTRASLSVVGLAPGEVERGFDLPDDFFRFIDQTQWSSQSALPAGGPVGNAAWMQSIAGNYSPILTLTWQIRGDQVFFLSPPFPTAATFSYMYMSKAQVIDAADPTILKNRANQNGDTFKLDGFLIMLLGRSLYLEWKGFDSSAATRDFLTVYNSRAGADKGAPILDLARRRGVALINPLTSVPYTGFGS